MADSDSTSAARPIRGNCFMYAGRRMLAEPDDTTAIVIHGTYEVFPGYRDVHGWFEKGALCWGLADPRLHPGGAVPLQGDLGDSPGGSSGGVLRDTEHRAFAGVRQGAGGEGDC